MYFIFSVTVGSNLRPHHGMDEGYSNTQVKCATKQEMLQLPSGETWRSLKTKMVNHHSAYYKLKNNLHK